MVIFFLPFSMALMYPLTISSARQMSPCDILLRVRIFLMLSPSLLLINIIITYKILHFQTILYYNSSVEAAKQNQKFPFHFLSAPPTPHAENQERKENFWFLPATEGSGRGAQNPSVRFNPEPPRAPRVRSRFAQSV